MTGIENKIEAAIKETLVISNSQSTSLAVKKIMKILAETFGPMVDTIDQLQAENKALINDLEKIKQKEEFLDVTQADLDRNPDWEKNGIKIGDRLTKLNISQEKIKELQVRRDCINKPYKYHCCGCEVSKIEPREHKTFDQSLEE